MAQLANLIIFVSILGSAFYCKAEVGVTDKEIVIGAHTIESGPAAAAAVASLAASAYFDMINEKGGVYGRKIKWIRKDSASLAPRSIEVMRELVERENIFAAVACAGSSHVAVYKYLNEKGVPDLYPGDGVSAYMDKSAGLTFPIHYPWENEGRAAAQYLIKNKKGANVCFLHTNEALSEDYMRGATTELKAANAKLKEADKFKFGPALGVERLGSQADSEVLKFKEDKCDVVMATPPFTLTPNAINYGFRQGFKPLWIVHTYNVSLKFIDLVKPEMHPNVVCSTNMAKDKTMVANQKGWDEYAALMAKNNITAGGTSSIGYTQAEMFVETLKRAGKDLTRQSLVKAAESFKGDWSCSLCLYPPTTSKDNHWPLSKVVHLVIKDKKWVKLD